MNNKKPCPLPADPMTLDIARRLCAFAFDIEGLNSVSHDDRQRCIDIADWVRRHAYRFTEIAARDRRISVLEAIVMELCDGMDHDDPECPEDDTCECANVARVNAALRGGESGT